MRKSFGGIKAPWRPVYDQSAYHITTAAGVYQTVLNITGKGKVSIFTGKVSWAVSDIYTEILIDGVTTHEFRFRGNRNYFQGDFHFNKSIRVRHKTSNANASTGIAYWVM